MLSHHAAFFEAFVASMPWRNKRRISGCGLDSQPDAILHEIISFLSLNEFLTFRLASKRIFQYSQKSETVWRRYVEKITRHKLPSMTATFWKKSLHLYSELIKTDFDLLLHPNITKVLALKKSWLYLFLKL